MTRTDANTLNRVYWRAVAKSEREAEQGVAPRAIGDGHTDGLRAVADAAERRVLDDLAEIIDSNLNIQRSTLVGFVVRKREELDRGDG